MDAPESWPLPMACIVLATSGAVLVFAGVRFTALVARMSDRLGVGRAISGAVLLGATTSIPGLIVTAVAAHRGDAELAVGNALGGIAAQTMFIALADLTHRPSNLEHAAASLPNLLQTTLLVALIATVLLATSGPDRTIGWVHPLTLCLPAIYVFGLRLVGRSHLQPMWRPLRTPDTFEEVVDEAEAARPARELVPGFVLLGATVAACGYLIAIAGLALSERSGLSGSLVGSLITGVVTSMPELVTALAAVRAGALTLAVGDIVGGNCFDVLFIAVADVAFLEGSLYAHIGDRSVFLLALTLLLTAFLASGLLSREREGIGFEGVAILVAYAAGMFTLSVLP